MYSHDDDLITNVGPEIDGVIWITEKPLKEKPRFYRQIDYFLDNLITSSLGTIDENKSSFFHTQQFGHDFFVLHASQNCKLDEDFKDYLKTLQSGAKKKTIFIIDEEGSTKKKLKDKYKKWRFLEIPS